MRIGLLDPGLLNRSGHHLEWDLRVVDELASLGHSVEVFANKRADRKVIESFSDRAKLWPLFEAFPYGDPGAIDPVAGELCFFLDAAAALAEDLRLIGELDLWFWPSLFAPQLYACSIVAPTARISGCIHVEPTFQAVNGRTWWRYAFLMAERANLSANIGVVVPLLKEDYSRLTASRPIELFPVAHNGAPSSIRKTALTRIGFFGHQRREKGAALLSELVPRLLRDGFDVVLHDSGDLIRAENAAGLTVLGYVPCLADEIAKCDVVVVPYDPPAYRSRGSGIVWDAIASGVPVIAPSDTAPSRLVDETGAGRTIGDRSVDAICRAIIDVRQNYQQVSMAAFEASLRWQTTHGVKRFVAAMLRNTTFPTPA
jgi:glycosyltransferase involved in cell wall biosynthesis